MCGICGIFGKNDESTLKKMLSVIPHRGPDDEFYIEGDSYCIGTRRLSIIDLEHGRQPLSNEDNSVWVAQNGEIYNFMDIRAALKDTHHFKTNCDTESIVHLYEEYNEKFLNQLSGMFAISLWDTNKNIGILARDKVGKKPLYYFIQDNNLYFASEIKSLLEIPDFKREINPEALNLYLSYKHIPCPLSIFGGIYQIPPSHFLTYNSNNSTVKTERYSSYDFSASDLGSEEKIINNLICLLKISVKKRLVSDVPIGFFLSGGVDSSLITAIAAEVSPGPIHTFCLTYDMNSEGKKLDEEFAREISKKYHTIHHEEQVTETNFINTFPKIISHFDEPFSGVFSTYFLSQVIAKHVKVAISGDGADELFGSYLSHRLSQIMPAEADDWKWRYKLLNFTDEEKQQLYSDQIKQKMKAFSTMEHLKKYFTNLTATDPLNRVLEAEFNSFFPDQVLTFVDRLSMAHSLEIRSPYLDSDFIQYAARIPGKLKIKDGETKYILKRAALRYLPEDLVFRKKEGFIMPFHIWLRDNLEKYVRATLSENRLRTHDFFNETYIQNLLDEYFIKKHEHTNKILTLLAFQIWYEMYMVQGGIP